MYYTTVLNAESPESCGGDNCNVRWDTSEDEWTNETDDCVDRCVQSQRCRLTPVDMQNDLRSYMDCEAGLYCKPGKRNNGLGTCTPTPSPNKEKMTIQEQANGTTSVKGVAQNTSVGFIVGIVILAIALLVILILLARLYKKNREEGGELT